MTDRETHLSLYRRWRPQRFEDVVNQSEIVRTLRNAVQAGEEAHAYLFAGERGIGKTSVARILARAVNCLTPDEGEPCNACAHCETILGNRSLDIVEIDGASNRGIDHIRRLREEVSFSPTDLGKKVYIIDEVHMLTNEAFNALLKTLEEPPAHALFVFATTEPHKVPRTILSRCQAFEFRRIASDDIAEHLARVAEAEGVKPTPEALATIAQRAEGGLRDALVMLEQAMSFDREDLTLETVLDMLGLAGRETHEGFIEALEANDRAGALRIVESLVDRGKDLETFLGDVIRLLRDRLAAGGKEGDVRLVRGLLDVKSDLFRAMDRTIRLEVGLLELMSQLHPERDASATASLARSRETEPAVGSERRNERAGPTSPASDALPHSSIDSATQKSDTDPSRSPNGDSDASFSADASPHATTPSPEGTGRRATSLTESQDKGGRPVHRVDPEIEATWASMLEEIGRERIAIAAFLTECQPTRKGDKLILHFHPAHTFHKESLEKGANLQYLAGVIRRHFGEDVRVDIAFDPGVERTPTAHELLRMKADLVCRVFDGKIVKEDV